MKHRPRKVALGLTAILALVLLAASMGTASTAAANNQPDNLVQLTDSFMGITLMYDRSQWVPSLFAENGDKAPAGVSQRVIGLFDQDTREMFLIATFDNSQRLTAAEWMKTYDYLHTSEPAIYSTSVVNGYPAQIVKEFPPFVVAGALSNMRAIVAAHDRIYVLEYASIHPSDINFEDWLSKVTFNAPGEYVKSSLRDDLTLSFKDAGIPLKPSVSNGGYSPLATTCCSITDPEPNPFPCNTGGAGKCTAPPCGNCTWWARYRRTGNNIANLDACTGDASSWDDCAARNYPDLLSSTPLASSVIVWTGTSDNHVAFIENMNTNGTFRVSQMGWSQTCPQSYYNSTSSGKVFIHYPGSTPNPPVGYIDAPAPSSLKTGTVRIEGWSKVDGSTIARVEIWIDSINRGNAIYGTPRPDAGGNYGYYWDWNTAQYGDGSHTIQVKSVASSNTTAWLLASNGQSSLSVTTDNTAPLNPTFASSGCGAANNVWQNTCVDPNFTWSGASDGNGSGVKDYHYYWGPSVGGTPDTYTSASNFDPPLVPGSVITYYLHISTRDNLNQESLPSTVFVFLYDASAPTATLQINHGAANANQVNVTLNLTASDTGSGVNEMRVSSNGVDWTNWQPFTAEIPWTMPALNRRTATVYAQVRDRAGNPSGTATASIYLDLYPIMPNSASYRICQDVMNVGGSARITSANYLLASAIGQPAASGATSATSGSFRGQSGFLTNLTACLPITYTVTSNYTLTQWVMASGGNIRGSASYRLGDTAGQPAASGAAVFSSTTYRMSSGFWAAITTTIPITTILPTPVPTHTPTPTPTPGPTATPQPASFGVTINDGALYTNNPQVTVRAWGPNIIETMLSNDGGFLNAPWQTYQLTYTWVLSTYGNTSMPRLVYVRFRDAANIEYGTYFDDIIYDPVAPQGSVAILDSQIVSTVTLWLDGQDDYSGIADVRLTDDPAMMNTASWEPYITTLEWDMAGKTVVYAQYRDKAGNLSPIYSSDDTTHNPNTKKVYLPLILK